jgi:hypothetical protein
MDTLNTQPAFPVPAPTVDDVRRISAMDDPVLRNLTITQCYSDLSQAMAEWLPYGANWCTMGTWASRQAGQSIRKDDLWRMLRRLLQESTEASEALETLEVQGAGDSEDPSESLAGAVDALGEALNPAAAFERVSQAVARGNLKVFSEIGFEFARFLALFGEGPPGEDAVAAFCRTLSAGDPPHGQRYLQQAFRHYYAALNSADGKERAELMLLANLEIGFHEQTRLQPEIRAAMDAPVYDPAALRRRLLLELFPNVRSRIRLVILRLAGRAGSLLDARDQLAAETQRLGRLVVTETMMTLELPRGRVLHLGKNLQSGFPDLLQTITNPSLLELLARVDPTPDSRAGTGAEDWSDLSQRIHFIADLFRAFHLDPLLFDQPFSEPQLKLIQTGHIPDDL